MKFKTLASTLLLSTFLVGGMATEAKAVTLPETSTHNVTFTDSFWTYSEAEGDWVAVTLDVSIDINGFYGLLPKSNFNEGYSTVERYNDIVVMQEGATLDVTISCPENPELLYNYYFDESKGIDEETLSGFTNASNPLYVPDSAGNVSSAIFFGTRDNNEQYIHGAMGAMSLLSHEERILFSESGPFGFENYRYWQSGEGEYTYLPNLGGSNVDFIVTYAANSCINGNFRLLPVLVINQESIDRLEANGSTLISTFTLEEMSAVAGAFFSENEFLSTYPGLLELLTAESPEVPETQAPTYSSWADVHVAFADENNLVVASLGDDYTVNITRAQIADLLVNMIEQYTGTTLSTEGSVQFNDTDSVTAQKANAAGIITGRDGNLFDGSANATRQEMAVMVHKAILKMEQTTNSILIDHSDVVYDFGDNQSIDNWATNAVYILANNNIMRGSDSGFEPKGNTTIEQSFVLNNNLFKLG